MMKNCLKAFKKVWAKQVNNVTETLLCAINHPFWWCKLLVLFSWKLDVIHWNKTIIDINLFDLLWS